MIETTNHDGVATIWLDRPDMRNALSAELIKALTLAVTAAVADPAVRVIVMAGRGKAFCAGADLNWMKQAGASYTPQQNQADSMNLASLMQALAESPKPTVARVQGAAYAGGLGLVCACDIAIAAEAARFCVSEVRIGLIPAMISPYLLRAIGPRMASRYFLTAEVFDGAEALRIGMVQQLVADDALDTAVAELCTRLAQGGPLALAAAKGLVRDFAHRPIDAALIADSARRIAEQRASAEGQEGIASFLEKRKPGWQVG